MEITRYCNTPKSATVASVEAPALVTFAGEQFTHSLKCRLARVSSDEILRESGRVFRTNEGRRTDEVRRKSCAIDLGRVLVLCDA